MINHILIFILLILVILLFIRKETFKISDCKFIARGRTKGDCLKNCMDPKLKQFYETQDDACSQTNCIEICNECKSSELCHWVNPFVTYDDDKDKQQRINEIKLSYIIEDNNLKLNWKWVGSYSNLSPLDNNYIIVFKEVNTNINNSSVLETNLKTYSFALEDNTSSLPLLKRNTEYIFIVYSTNKVRKNGTSNLVNVKI